MQLPEGGRQMTRENQSHSRGLALPEEDAVLTTYPNRPSAGRGTIQMQETKSRKGVSLTERQDPGEHGS